MFNCWNVVIIIIIVYLTFIFAIHEKMKPTQGGNQIPAFMKIEWKERKKDVLDWLWEKGFGIFQGINDMGLYKILRTNGEDLQFI